jgi:Spy/CpxP family protein refolding chaperone
VKFLRVIPATLVIFATGACTGYFIARKPAGTAASPGSQSVLASTNAPSDWNKQRDEMRVCLQKEIKATDEQMAKVDEILAESRKRSREIWQTIKVPMEAEVVRVQEEIRGVLDPEQAAKYEEIMKQRGKRGNGGSRDKEKKKSDPQSCRFNGGPDRQCFL